MKHCGKIQGHFIHSWNMIRSTAEENRFQNVFLILGMTTQAVMVNEVISHVRFETWRESLHRAKVSSCQLMHVWTGIAGEKNKQAFRQNTFHMQLLLFLLLQHWQLSCLEKTFAFTRRFIKRWQLHSLVSWHRQSSVKLQPRVFHSNTTYTWEKLNKTGARTNPLPTKDASNAS